MKKSHILLGFLLAVSLLLAGCGKGGPSVPAVNATTPIEADAAVLGSVSVTLPDGMTRQAVSNIQHDFLKDGKQVGGIVLVDLSGEMLNAPYDNLLRISDLLGQQLMPQGNADDLAFLGAGGNAYAYLEFYTGGDKIRYFHYLFRGEAHNYDVWFAYDWVNEETMNGILASVCADDITLELNKSVM